MTKYRGYSYRKGVTYGPAMVCTWDDRDGAVRDFSSGWTFGVKIVNAGTTTLAVTPGPTITGAATAPNVTIDWISTDFSTLTAGRNYDVILTATPSAGDPIEFPGELGFSLYAAAA